MGHHFFHHLTGICVNCGGHEAMVGTDCGGVVLINLETGDEMTVDPIQLRERGAPQGYKGMFEVGKRELWDRIKDLINQTGKGW